MHRHALDLFLVGLDIVLMWKCLPDFADGTLLIRRDVYSISSTYSSPRLTRSSPCLVQDVVAFESAIQKAASLHS